MLFDLSGKHGVPPSLSYLVQYEDEPSAPDIENLGLHSSSCSILDDLVDVPVPRSGADMLESTSKVWDSRISYSGKLSSSSSVVSSSEVSRRLHLAKREARLRELRLRLPTVVGGAILSMSSLFLAVTSAKYSLYYVVGAWLGSIGAYAGMLGFLPSDKVALPLAGMCIFIPAGLLFNSFFLRQMLNYVKLLRDGQCLLEEDVVPCWYICILLALRGTDVIPGLVMIVRIIYALKTRTMSKCLLSIYWAAFGWFWMILGMTSIPKSGAGFLVGSVTVAVGILASGVPFLISGSMMLINSDFRRQVQSWFMSRSESALTAAGVGELIGGQDIKDLLVSARSSFKFVRADRVTRMDMKDNLPNPGLAALTEKGRLGFIDAFVSHSWHDDPDSKWNALQEFREAFKSKHLREPRLWIDKYSIDQNNIDLSLASLPVYMSGCSQLWILCGQTYLERLWCIIEIFVYLEMGGQRSNLHVKLLDDFKDKLVGKYLSEFSTASTASAVAGFNPRKARCFTEYDTDRLHAVIETTGYNQISQLIKDVFLSSGEYSSKISA